MNIPIKFDWDKKRDEILLKTKNDSREIKKYVLNCCMFRATFILIQLV